MNCQIAPKGHVCFTSQTYAECYEQKSYCDGVSKKCPQQQPKPRNTLCSSYDSGRCSTNGHCLSLCQQYNPLLLPCQCSEEDEKCLQCCQANINSTCMPLYKIRGIEKSLYLSDGRPCLRGICVNVCISNWIF